MVLAEAKRYGTRLRCWNLFHDDIKLKEIRIRLAVIKKVNASVS